MPRCVPQNGNVCNVNIATDGFLEPPPFTPLTLPPCEISKPIVHILSNLFLYGDDGGKIGVILYKILPILPIACSNAPSIESLAARPNMVSQFMHCSKHPPL